jgi:competence protein ComEC
MPLFWLSIAFLVGIILASVLPVNLVTWLFLASTSLVLTAVQYLRKRRENRSLSHPPQIHQGQRFSSPPSLAILFTALFIGAARYIGVIPDLTNPRLISAHNDTGQQMMVTGTIDAMPEKRDTSTYLRVEVERMHPSGDLHYAEVTGLILVTTSTQKDFQYGDRVVIRGYLETPPEDETFSYRDYLARQGIYTQMRGAKVSLLENNQGSWLMRQILELRSQALQLVFRLWPDPEASLLAGILLGVETTIPEPVQQAFQESGTSHIIAISGFNIAIVAALFTRSLGRIMGPYKGGLAAVVAITIYTILVGADAAVVRAAIMGSLSLFAELVGRRQRGVYTLVITAGIMAAADPQIPWDIGFQLSFAASLGLILYAEPLAQAFTRLASRWIPEETAQKISGPVGEFVLFTLAAQITTLPIIATHFGTLSWIAFLANPLILPAQPPIMILGGFALILGLIWQPLGRITAPLAWPFVLFTIRAVEFFSRHTRGTLTLGEFGLIWVILFYSLLILVTFKWPQIHSWLKAQPERLQTGLWLPAAGLLGVLTVVLWRGALSAPDGRLHLTLLEVGTGDAVLIQTPEGRYALINGGPSTSLLSDSLGRRLPPFHRGLDWLVIASPRSEQIAGLSRNLDRFPPTHVLWAGLPSPAREADYLRENLTARSIPITSGETGQALQFGDGAGLRVLTAGRRGAILLLEWDRFRALLPLGVNDGDFESLRMGAAIGKVDVLLLADSGYAPLNPPEWIHNLNPTLVLLSVAADDRDGLPDQDTLTALDGYTLLRTDQKGWIHLSTDGEKMWVEVAKR